MIRGGALTHVALGLTVFLLLAVVHSQVDTYHLLFFVHVCALWFIPNDGYC